MTLMQCWHSIGKDKMASKHHWSESIQMHKRCSCLHPRKCCIQSGILLPPALNYHKNRLEGCISYYTHPKSWSLLSSCIPNILHCYRIDNNRKDRPHTSGFWGWQCTWQDSLYSTGRQWWGSIHQDMMHTWSLKSKKGSQQGKGGRSLSHCQNKGQKAHISEFCCYRVGCQHRGKTDKYRCCCK